MNVNYTLTGSESGGTQILVVINGRSRTINENHPFFTDIRDKLFAREFDGLERLVDAQTVILKSLSSRVSLVGDTIHYNGQPLYSKLADTIISFFRAGRDFTPLVRFLERLMLNESLNSRTQFYEFLDAHNFSITEDGHFLAYKGVQQDFRAITRGPGIVNGIEQGSNAYLDNTPGNVLEMTRSQVVDDPNVACDVGLHVGAWSYARGFGPQVVECKIDPADVVSVPRDSSFQKIRVCRYVVLRAVTEEVNHEERYDVADDFFAWLDIRREGYTRKGRMGASYEHLAEQYLEAQEQVGTDREALLSLASELDFAHESKSVYRYHVDALLAGEEDEEDDSEYEVDEDDFWGYGPDKTDY